MTEDQTMKSHFEDKRKEILLLQQKLNRLKKKRLARFDPNTRTCTNCAKNYTEIDNFNWSCTTHRSQWGGSMWWCCGKTKEFAMGCKQSKH